MVIGGRETRYGWQGVAPAVLVRGIGARVGAEVGGAVPCVAWHGVGRARAGERARPEFRLEGAKTGVQGRRVRVRRARFVLGAASRELTRACAHSGYLDRGRKESKRLGKVCSSQGVFEAREEASTHVSLKVAVNDEPTAA
jgi:hypothetical protein